MYLRTEHAGKLQRLPSQVTPRWAGHGSSAAMHGPRSPARDTLPCPRCPFQYTLKEKKPWRSYLRKYHNFYCSQFWEKHS